MSHGWASVWINIMYTRGTPSVHRMLPRPTLSVPTCNTLINIRPTASHKDCCIQVYKCTSPGGLDLWMRFEWSYTSLWFRVFSAWCITRNRPPFHAWSFPHTLISTHPTFSRLIYIKNTSIVHLYIYFLYVLAISATDTYHSPIRGLKRGCWPIAYPPK